MGKRKKSKNTNSKQNKLTVIILEIATMLTLIILVVAVSQGSIFGTVAQTTRYVLQNQENGNAFGDSLVPDYVVETEIVTEIVVLDDGNQVVVTENKPIDAVTVEDPSDWSYDKILRVLTDAVNKTKSYTGPLEARHRESFDASVTECTGGSLVKSVAEMMIGWVVKPTDENLVFSNGKAVNSEGESIPALLPIKNNFCLTVDGVSYAEITLSGDMYIIDIELVREKVGMYETPEHNASAIGYLDVGNFDLSFLEIDRADITYRGSGMTFYVNSKGYITYAKYDIPLRIEGAGHKGNISGAITFEGKQTEEWGLYY